MKYTVIVKKGCPFCKSAIELLTEIKQEGDQLDVEVENENFSREEFKNKFGKNATYPRVYFGKDYIGGYIELKDLVEEYVEEY